MKVFISWSGKRSNEVGHALRTWLPMVVQAVDAWMSESDIQKGQRWAQEIGTQLQDADLGIICCTPENIRSPWLLFESGALSHRLRSRVCTYLFELTGAQVDGPLSQFQHTLATKEDTRKLVHTVYGLAEKPTLSAKALDELFDAMWPRLEIQLQSIDPPGEKVEYRSSDSMIEEILTLSRLVAQRLNIQKSALLYTHDVQCEDYINQGQSLDLQNLRGVSLVSPQGMNRFDVLADRQIPLEEIANAVKPNRVIAVEIRNR